MWREARLAFTDSLAALNCSVVPAHPWINGLGQQTDNQTPVYSAVPLPVPMAGNDSGMFQFPPEGTLVEVAFTGGRPDKPFIRQTLPDGTSLPDVKPGEQLQQQRAEVSQRVTQAGDWVRQTDQTISETSMARTVKADTERRDLVSVTPQKDLCCHVTLTALHADKINLSQTKTALHRTRLRFLARYNFSVFFFYKTPARAAPVLVASRRKQSEKIENNYSAFQF